MIKQTISYIDYNEEKVTEDFWFHISKVELTADLKMADEFMALGEELQARSKEGDGDLDTPMIQQILDLVKKLIKMSYGVRSEDGKKFRKSDENWADFADSAAYDSILFEMFVDTTKAIAFMNGILPKDLIEQAKKQDGPKAPQDRLEKAQPEKAAVETVAFEGSVEQVLIDTEPTPPTKEEQAEALRRQLAELEG